MTTWVYAAILTDVSDGIHQLSINNISTAADKKLTTNAHDHFLLRVGQGDNPITFPAANYSSNMLFKGINNTLCISHKAAGADMFRYSLNFGTTYSDWEEYPVQGNSVVSLTPIVWSGTELQAWKGEHVIVQYWSRLAGSSNHAQSADLGVGPLQRRFPHLFLEGRFNQYGFDEGFANQMQMDIDNVWRFNFVHDWPARISANVWGINPDGKPDQSRIYGDIDGDYVLDRIPPHSLIDNVINITEPPPSPFLAWQLAINDADYRLQLIPIGSRWNQLILFILLCLVPVLAGAAAVWAFVKSFYGVKLNKVGTQSSKRRGVHTLSRTFGQQKERSQRAHVAQPRHKLPKPSNIIEPHDFGHAIQFLKSPIPKRLTVLVATMEYEIEDWGLKVKIGGLGVMSSLMGKNLKHQDLVWVIPW